VDPLKAALRDPSAVVRTGAASALGALGRDAKGALVPLQDARGREKDARALAVMDAAASRITRGEPPAVEDGPVVVKSDAADMVRVRALRAAQAAADRGDGGGASGDVANTRAVGGPGGSVFGSSLRVNTAGKTAHVGLGGLRVTTRPWETSAVALSSLEALWKASDSDRFGKAVGEAIELRARPGYAVGGLVVHATRVVEGLQVLFLKVLEGDRLDPEDGYLSPLVGAATTKPVLLAGDGRLVSGVHGRHGEVIDALGLVVVRPRR
jgi:hypothetical protein